MKLSKIPKSLYLIWIIGAIVVSLLVFIQHKLPANEGRSSDQIQITNVFRSTTYKYSVRYPSGWYLNDEVVKQTDSLFITNFPPNQYIHGGILPKEGAEIVIKVNTSFTKQLSDFIDQDIQRATLLSKESITINGLKTIKIVYLSKIGPGTFYKNVAMYFSNKGIYKILLSFREGDPKESFYLSTLNSIVSSFSTEG